MKNLLRRFSYVSHTHKFRTTMTIRKIVLQVTTLFAAAGAQAQNPNIQTIYTADPADPINNKLKMNTASKSIFTLVFAIIFSLVSISTLSAQTVWLDQLDLSPTTQGWGVPKKNRTVDDNIMTIAGKTFERGFGTHAESSLFIQLNGSMGIF